MYDVGYLQTHPLLTLVEKQASGNAPAGSHLRQALLDTIEALRPGPDIAPNARAWRLHHILELRYIECHDTADVIDQVALSSAQYHREHHRALQMVAVMLWERWQAASRWMTDSGGPREQRSEEIDSVRREAEGLLHDRRAGRVDIGQVVQDLHVLLRPLSAGRAIEITLHVQDHLSAIVGERVAVRQLFLVLLSHVVSAVEQGTIEVRLANQARRVAVTVTGPAGSVLDQIQQGLGESRPFVEALRGTVTFRPPAAMDDGWTIEISLPAHARPTLLVVDNNTDFVRLVELYLTGDEWEIIGASTVEEAISYAQQRHPNVILLDVIIPGRDGWDLLQDLRAQTTTLDIPVIICSVLNEPGMATALGASAYLQKPVSQDQLVAALKPFH
jgi:CheY-like chemotaxis protein